MTTVLLDVLRTGLGWMFVVYTALTASHFVIQLWYAHRTHRRFASAEFKAAFPDYPVSVDVLIPVYNEDPELLARCIRSALRQDHVAPVRVIVVDDGSPNRASLDPVYDAVEREGATVIRRPMNAGKRHAQAAGLDACTSEIVVTLDSDSILEPDAVRKITRQFADERIGAVTGFVDVENHRRNALTRVQRIRYWMAFNQERAAQSWFRTVLCCSGPLSAYRRSLLLVVRESYVTQSYGGVACTFGDDRHLTNLILAAGYDSVYDEGAIAWTHVPESWPQFLRQQLRWSKSFFRELVWTAPFIARRPWYSRFDLTCQVAMPFILPLTTSVALVLGVHDDPAHVVKFVALIALVAALRATYGALRHRDVRFYWFVVYGFISAFVLVPIRFRALWTLTDARWGTRGLSKAIQQAASAASTGVAGGLALAPAGAAGASSVDPAPGRERPEDRSSAGPDLSSSAGRVRSGSASAAGRPSRDTRRTSERTS
jgi:hyaluronan synthase/N-acetylglucosaminyltransferase